MSYVKSINDGLIHQTHIVSNGSEQFVLQFVNQKVFRNYDLLASNYTKVLELLTNNSHFEYEKLIYIKNKNDQWFSCYLGQVFRIAQFIDHDEAVSELSKETCWNLGKCLGDYHAALNVKSISIEEALPNFLNFGHRIYNFQNALISGNFDRIEANQIQIKWLIHHAEIIGDWNLKLKSFPQRVIHGDAKFSNFLFKNFKIKSLIDWDTVMLGNVHYDLGDLIRSCISTTEENNIQVVFKSGNFESVLDGYRSSRIYQMLSNFEKEQLSMSALPVIYIQALRFFTDFLEDDRYYSIHYETENLDKTLHQIQLFEELKKYLF